MTTSLNDLTPAPDGTKWELTITDSNKGNYQARLVRRKDWQTLGAVQIPGSMSKYKAAKETAAFIERITNG